MYRAILLLSLLSAVLRCPPSVASQDAENTQYGNFRDEKDEKKPRARVPHLKFYLKPVKELSIMISENEVLECQAGGYPPPVIHWLKDGQIIDSEEEDSFTESYEAENLGESMLGIGSTGARLFLNCASPEDSGVYTCVAETPYRRISTHAHVTVDSALRFPMKTCRQRGTNIAPKILMWSKKRLEFMGENVRLYCRAGGSPKPLIQWLNTKGDPIDNSEKYKILPSGDLIIHQLKWRDMGNYACIAANIAGTDRIETFLYPTKPEK